MTGANDPHSWDVQTLRIYTQGQVTQLHEEMVALRREVDSFNTGNVTGREAVLVQLNARFAEVDTALARTENRLTDITERINRNEGRVAGAGALWNYLIGGLGLVLAVLAAILAYSNNQRLNALPEGAGMIVVGSVYASDESSPYRHVGSLVRPREHSIPS